MKPIAISQIEWFSPDDCLPECSTQAAGNPFVIVMIVDMNGSTWAGDYTDGKFYLANTEGSVEIPKVKAWAYWPEVKFHTEELVHPKCPGCGHNYFDAPKRPKNPDGSYPTGGLCQWCIEEEADGTYNDDDDEDW